MDAEGAELSGTEIAELRWAYQQLEHPSLASRLSSQLGQPVEDLIGLLPVKWQARLEKTFKTNIYLTVRAALLSMDSSRPSHSHDFLHKALAMGAGAAGGYFGPLTLLIELPFTTSLMLRSIADIARSYGEDLTQDATRVACVQVFALGARTKEDEAADVGYYALRTILGLHFERDIVEYAVGAKGPHIPAFVELTRAIAARFGVVISEQMAVKMVPIAGAISGAGLNLIFMKHFQDVARGHFIVRRLERQHGVEVIKAEYQRLAAEEASRMKEFTPVVGF
jgi:hypothetical protein